MRARPNVPNRKKETFAPRCLNPPLGKPGDAGAVRAEAAADIGPLVAEAAQPERGPHPFLVNSVYPPFSVPLTPSSKNIQTCLDPFCPPPHCSAEAAPQGRLEVLGAALVVVVAALGEGAQVLLAAPLVAA